MYDDPTIENYLEKFLNGKKTPNLESASLTFDFSTFGVIEDGNKYWALFGVEWDASAGWSRKNGRGLVNVQTRDLGPGLYTSMHRASEYRSVLRSEYQKRLGDIAWEGWFDKANTDMAD